MDADPGNVEGGDMIAIIKFMGEQEEEIKIFGEDLNISKNMIAGEWSVFDGQRCIFVARVTEIKYIMITHYDRDAETYVHVAMEDPAC